MTTTRHRVVVNGVRRRVSRNDQFLRVANSCPIPIDMHILRAMKRSSLGLDLYLWLTYRMFTLTCIIHEGPDSTAKGRDRRRNGSRTSLPASGAGV